jgi:putative PIN family toxin of toxin-antitoxin system
MAVQRIVLDTNIWLDWLLFEDTGIAHIRQLQEAARLEIVVNADCEAEFAEVIARKFRKKTLDAREQAAALARLRRASTRVDARPTPAERARLPLCRDPDDQKFLELALAAGADVVVTRDKALLDLTRRKKAQVGRTVPFRILHPDDF